MTYKFKCECGQKSKLVCSASRYKVLVCNCGKLMKRDWKAEKTILYTPKVHKAV